MGSILTFFIFVAFGQVNGRHTSDFFHKTFDGKGLFNFNENYENGNSKYEIIYLPVDLIFREAVGERNSDSEAELNFNAFGKTISLKLQPNKKLVSSSFKTYVQYGSNRTKLLPYDQENCHFLHRDDSSVASISICQPDYMQGLLLLNNATFEIQPITSYLNSALTNKNRIFKNKKEIPHIITKVSNLHDYFKNDIDDHEMILIEDEVHYDINNKAANHKPVDALTLELALFFDAEAYKTFSPYFNYDNYKLRNMLLAYINGIQALYHHPSLGVNLELVLVRLDIMQSQSSHMPHHNGERSKLLDSFCNYQKSINPIGDSNPDHWDMALYVSGLDFFTYENDRKNSVTMGLATVGGVCLSQYACVIAEMGTRNSLGKPYPSAGFTSVYILAHEIGHNLGMHHDSNKNNCPKEGYIMSPSRGVQGETQWSRCSAEVMKKLNKAKCLLDSQNIARPSLNHAKFQDTPGQIFNAKQQCEIFLQDRDAVVSPKQISSKICFSIECKTPHRSGFYYAGPALEGTECGKGKYCFGGECISKESPVISPEQLSEWSPWKSESCTSGCIQKSVGYQIMKRICDNAISNEGCSGSSYNIILCNDDEICSNTDRKSVLKYASEKCRSFSNLLPDLDSTGVGFQASHENDRTWIACAIFCRKGDSGIFYTPRMELNDLGISPYFPDGTWCHSDFNGENYYCRQHYCLPQRFSFNVENKNILDDDVGGDVPLLQNARPRNEFIEGFGYYFSLFPNGKPILTILKPEQLLQHNEEEWEINDYIEIPLIKK